MGDEVPKVVEIGHDWKHVVGEVRNTVRKPYDRRQKRVGQQRPRGRSLLERRLHDVLPLEVNKSKRASSRSAKHVPSG